jgi:protein-tyrosine-phosphatase
MLLTHVRLRRQKSQPRYFNQKDVNSPLLILTYDYIYVMDQSNYKNVLNLAENENTKQSANHLK